MPMVAMADIKITLETLYDLLRNEKKREDLQKLDGTFFLDAVLYLREKQALLESKQKSNELFAAGERDKLEYELRSIKRILKEFYDRREKKILDIALNKSRTGSEIIDTSAMLSLEREFYNRVLKTLDDFRRGILQAMFLGELPNLPDQKKLEVEIKKELPAVQLQQSGQHHLASATAAVVASSSDRTKIKIIHPLPQFVWKDLKAYGPYEEGEEIEMFPEVAELMVRKGRAVKIM